MYTCTVEMLESIQNSFIPPLFSIHDLAQGFSAKRGRRFGEECQRRPGYLQDRKTPLSHHNKGERRAARESVVVVVVVRLRREERRRYRNCFREGERRRSVTICPIYLKNVCVFSNPAPDLTNLHLPSPTHPPPMHL